MGRKTQNCYKTKSQGWGIMVSDFIEEHSDYLRMTNEEFTQGQVTYPDLKQEARTLLRFGADYEG